MSTVLWYLAFFRTAARHGPSADDTCTAWIWSILDAWGR